MNNAPMKITATVGAYIRPEWHTPAKLLEAVDNPDQHPHTVASMLMYSSMDMSKHWTRVGDAEITVTLMPRDQAVAAAVKCLQDKLEKERADSMQRQNLILMQISKLQAITYDEARTVDV